MVYYPTSIAGSSFIDKVVFKCLMDVGHKGIRTMFTYMAKEEKEICEYARGSILLCYVC